MARPLSDKVDRLAKQNPHVIHDRNATVPSPPSSTIRCDGDHRLARAAFPPHPCDGFDEARSADAMSGFPEVSCPPVRVLDRLSLSSDLITSPKTAPDSGVPRITRRHQRGHKSASDQHRRELDNITQYGNSRVQVPPTTRRRQLRRTHPLSGRAEIPAPDDAPDHAPRRSGNRSPVKGCVPEASCTPVNGE
jgi:hypothetical protein